VHALNVVQPLPWQLLLTDNRGWLSLQTTGFGPFMHLSHTLHPWRHSLLHCMVNARVLQTAKYAHAGWMLLPYQQGMHAGLRPT
jgi:hypothetical protein